MDHQMTAGGNPGGALAPVGPSEGIIAPTQGMLGGGGGFSETWAINKDKHVFVNKKTNEEAPNLYIVVDKMHPARVLFPKNGPQKGERACWSDDGIASYQGIACASCPHIAQVDEFNKYYEANQGIQRPGYVGDCSLRYSLYWTKEFIVNADGSLTLRVHDQRVLVNVPQSSIYALWGRGAYTSKLEEQKLDIRAVVTRLMIKQRENAGLKTMYDYADFELVGTLESIMPRVTKTVRIAADASSGVAPATFPANGSGTGSLPTMAGQPTTHRDPSLAPAAGFPASGFQPAAAPAAAAPGFPPTAAPGFQPAAPGFPPAAAPGFPPVAAAPGFPAAAPVPAAAAPSAPAPSFQDMARSKLLSDFAALPDNVKPIVLNVLGVADINQITNEKVIWASQALASAKGFTGAVPVGAGHPF